jgi:hypothetical protein
MAACVLLVAAGILFKLGLADRWLQGLLTVEDPLLPADIAITTTDSGLEGDLELADLIQAHVVPKVGYLAILPTAYEREYARRGILLEDPRVRLEQLGVPEANIVRIMAGEGGTTDASSVIAAWCRTAGLHRAIIVATSSHSRRVRRALRRSIGSAGVEIRMHRPRFDRFRCEYWWRSRSMLRVALPEIQKLVLDYAMHPLS